MLAGKCDRCQGQMVMSGDRFGPYFLCVNCGRYIDKIQGPPIPLPPAPPSGIPTKYIKR